MVVTDLKHTKIEPSYFFPLKLLTQSRFAQHECTFWAILDTLAQSHISEMLCTTAVLFVGNGAAALEQLGSFCALLKANLTNDLPIISLLPEHSDHCCQLLLFKDCHLLKKKRWCDRWHTTLVMQLVFVFPSSWVVLKQESICLVVYPSMNLLMSWFSFEQSQACCVTLDSCDIVTKTLKWWSGPVPTVHRP